MAAQGLNGRVTPGFVVDGAGETYLLGNDIYPTTRGGIGPFGFPAGTNLVGDSRDRYSDPTIDRRVSGFIGVLAGVTKDLRFDLPSTGVGTIRMGIGDIANPGTDYVQLLDGGVPFATITATTTGTLQITDATGVSRPADFIGGTSWATQNAALSHTFTSTEFTIRLGNGTDKGGRLAHVSVDMAAADTQAPVLSSPTATPTGPTTATGTVSTTEANGTLFRLTSTNASETSGTLIASGAQTTVTATGVQNISATGLTASTANLRHHFVHRDAAGNVSNVVSSAAFSTPAAGDTTPPTLGAVTAAATAPTVVTGSVSTNEASGALYRRVSANATESQATMEAGGLFQSVTATGVQNVTAAAPAGTNGLRLHLMHVDASGNKSAVVSSATFNTPAVPVAAVTSKPFKNGTGALQTGLSGLKIAVLPLAMNAVAKAATGTTHATTAVNVVSDSGLVAGTKYVHVALSADDTIVSAEILTAA